MAKEYKWTLEKGSRKFNCPGCGKKTFKKYVFAATKEYVGDAFGRCDRDNNCQYHLIPESDTPQPPNPHTKRNLPPPTELKPSADYIEGIKKALGGEFHRFCIEKLHISADFLHRWHVGQYWKFTAFISANVKGEFINAKFVAYTTEGKRDKSEKDGKPNFIPHYLGKSYLRNQKIETDNARLEDWQDYYHFGRCFYGEHLFDATKDTCIVESEKSALMAAWFFPAYNWLATGGNNGLTFDSFKIFYNYSGRIHNLVDNDLAGIKKSKTIEWLDALAKNRNNPDEIRSLNLFESRPIGWDIADAIIYDNYRSPEQLAKDIAQAIDVRKKIVINEQTGEVHIEDKQKGPDEKEYKRAKQVADRIFQAKTLIWADSNILDLAASLASFGQKGLDIFVQVMGVNDGFDKAASERVFDLGMASAHKTPDYYFKAAKAAGIDVRYIKKAKLEAAEGAERINTQEWTFSWPDKMDELPDFDEEYTRQMVFDYGFLEHKNCYYNAIFDQKATNIFFINIANFVIKPLYLILSKTDPKRLFEIRNVWGVKKILDIPAKALVSLTEFKVFCESQGNFLFRGADKDFVKIKSKLYNDTKDAYEVKMLGWQPEGFYAFANGAFNGSFHKVDEYGIIKHNISIDENTAEERHFFIPAMSKIYMDEKDTYESEKKFVYIPRPDVKFVDWVKLFYQCYGGNGIIGLSFYITSLFRDMIYARFKFFPHLFLFGPPGTGKSTMAWSIQYMFGLERKPFMLNAGTAVGFHRTFAQFRNAVVWFDEYNNSIEFKRVQDLKSAYDGAGHVKGEWSASGGSSNKTTTTPVESTCIISGQELPIADNALFKRCILLQYHQTLFTDTEKANMNRLKELQEKGMSHITGNLTRFRDKMKAEYFDTFDKVEQELMAEFKNDANIESRIVLNMCTIATTFKVLEKDLPWPYTWEVMKEAIVANIKSQNGLITNAKETNQFWDTIDYLISMGELKDGLDFKIEFKTEINVNVDGKVVTRKLTKGSDVLNIRLSTSHPKYMEALRKQGEKKGMDKGSLAHYLEHSTGFLGKIKSTNFKVGDKFFASSAYAFDYKVIEDMGYNFNRSDVGAEENTKAMEAAIGKEPDIKDAF